MVHVKKENSGHGTYIVGYLDILGFKYHLDTVDFEIIKNTLERIIIHFIEYKRTGKKNDYWRPLQHSKKREKRFNWFDPNINQFTFINFSDSIIIYSKIINNDKNNEKIFINLCDFLNKLIFKPILDPLRPDLINVASKGAISMGKAYTDPINSIFFGDPFTNAYILIEKQNWMGGIIDQKNIPKEWILKYNKYDQPIIKYPIKNKEEEILGYFALNWPQSHWCEDKYKKPNNYRDGPYFHDLDHHIRKHDWGVIGMNKRDNSLQFAEYVCGLWDKFEKSN